MQISINRQFLAALGEGTMFTDLEQQWATGYATVKNQSHIVKETKNMRDTELLAIAQGTTVLSIA